MIAVSNQGKMCMFVILVTLYTEADGAEDVFFWNCGVLRRCYRTNKQVSVHSTPTPINFLAIAGPTRELHVQHIT